MSIALITGSNGLVGSESVKFFSKKGFDILGIDNENMRLIGFVDAGTLSEKVSNFNFNDLRSSIGIQLSWLTPIGPIGINLAQPIIKKSEDKTEVFAFELGAKF